MTATVLHLPTAPTLAAVDVARLTDSRTYARGVEYVRRGRVVVTRRLDHAISATVRGSTTYTTHVEVGRHGVEHRCSCPVGLEGTFCKHLVALVLTAAASEASDDGDELLDALDALAHDELVALVAAAAVEVPHVATMVADRLATGRRPADLAAYRRAIDDGERWEHRAHGVIDAVEELLAAGRTTEVVAFCTQAAACLDGNAQDISDDEAVARLAERLADLTRRAGAQLGGTGRPA